MKINIVMGFFLPVPPLAGGATEKSWHGLAREFAARGHLVTVLTRDWPGLAPVERDAGVTYLRLRGFTHTSSLARNLWRDFRWSVRVWCHLPVADVTITNCVALPAWLGWWPRGSGRVVVLPGRMPKGQFRIYRCLDRVLAVSSVVRAAVLEENPHLASVTRLFGYPINGRLLLEPRPDRPPDTPLTIGYVGRIHREKGLELLTEAATRLAKRRDLPPWRLLLCGPTDVARGGSGDDFAASLATRLSSALPAGRFELRPPEFDEEPLAGIYRGIDIFCYPSLAMRGETFGVAVLEAMAAGAVPLVSGLPSFTDFVRPEDTGVVFDHTASDPAGRLSDALAGLLAGEARRGRLAEAARTVAAGYDFPCMAERLLKDFSTLLPTPFPQH